jgi:hypothetical protein
MSFTDRLMVRVWTSVDFTIPSDARPFGTTDQGDDVFYLPITILAKWPPVMRFDLRDEDDRPIPLLTSRKNREVDAAVLQALVPEMPSRGQAPEVQDLVRSIAEGDRVAATGAQDMLVQRLAPYVGGMTPSAATGWFELRELLAPEVENSLLWVRVTGQAGQRQIVKYGYEQPVEPQLFFFRSILGALSWREISNVYAVARVDWTHNFHLQIDAPVGLVFHSAELVVEPPRFQSPAVDYSRPQAPNVLELLGGFAGVVRRAIGEAGALAAEVRDAVRQRLANVGRMAADPDLGITMPRSASPFEEPREGETFAWNNGHRAYLYVSRAKSPFAVAKFSFVAPSKSVHAPLAANILLAMLMTLITIAAGPVSTHDTDAVTALVVVPALLGLLVLRPGEHPLVRRHIAGVRGLLVAAGSTPVLAALVLVVHTHPKPSNVLPFFIPLTAVAWLAAGALALSAVLPASGWRG